MKVLLTHYCRSVISSLFHWWAGNLRPSHYCCGLSELLMRKHRFISHNDLLYTITSGQHRAISAKSPVTPVFRCPTHCIELCQHLFSSIKHKKEKEAKDVTCLFFVVVFFGGVYIILALWHICVQIRLHFTRGYMKHGFNIPESCHFTYLCSACSYSQSCNF